MFVVTGMQKANDISRKFSWKSSLLICMDWSLLWPITTDADKPVNQVKTQSEYVVPATSAEQRVWPSHDWFWL